MWYSYCRRKAGKTEQERPINTKRAELRLKQSTNQWIKTSTDLRYINSNAQTRTKLIWQHLTNNIHMNLKMARPIEQK